MLSFTSVYWLWIWLSLLYTMVSLARLAKTLAIQTGRKLADKSREDIVKAVSNHVLGYGIMAIQIGYEVIRVTFHNDESYKRAMQKDGLHLFGLYCKILGGGPSITMVHVFNYPFEEEDLLLKTVFSDFGQVKSVKKQTYLFEPSIYTGTRLVSLVLKAPPALLNHKWIYLLCVVQGSTPCM